LTTIQDLITYTRQRANIEDNQFCTDDELITYINRSLAELDDCLITRYEDYKITTYLATLTNGDYIIPLPPDFLKVRAIDYSPSVPPNGNGWYTINQYQLPERNRYNNSIQNIASPWGKVTLSSRVMGDSIYMAPQDEAGGEYQIWYTPKYQWLPLATDALPYYMDTQAWSEFAVVSSCVKIMNKMVLDPSGFMAEKQEQKDRVISAAKNRDSSGPKRVANVRFAEDYGPFGQNGF